MNRYYATTVKGWWRPYRVVHQSTAVRHYRYTVVSRHFTWKAAQKRVRILNAREGNAQ